MVSSSRGTVKGPPYFLSTYKEYSPMAYIVLGSLNQLQLQIPTEGTKDWGNNLKDNFVIKIVEHDHSGNGKGAPLGINSFADNIVNDIKIRLRNDQFLRARNSSNTGDINILKVAPNNAIEIGEVGNSIQINSEINVAQPATFQSSLNLGGTLDLVNNSIINASEIRGTLAELTKVNSPNINLIPVSSDPISPSNGQLQYSSGVHRAQGLWQYQSGTWVSIQGEVGANSVNTAAIQDNAVTTVKISDSNITTDKINDGAVTYNKLSALNYVESSNISSIVISQSFSNITSITITTTGRPFLVGLRGIIGGNADLSTYQNASSTSVFSQVRLSLNSNPLLDVLFTTTHGTASSSAQTDRSITSPATAINTVILLPAGTHTIYLSHRVTTSGPSNSISGCRLFAYEL